MSIDNRPCPLSVLFRKLYWTDGDTVNIANTDGSNHSILFTDQKGPVGQWLEQAAYDIERIPVSLGFSVNPLDFFPGLSIDFDTEQLYWISSGNSTINRCRLDGSGLEVLDGAKGKLTKATALAIMGEF